MRFKIYSITSLMTRLDPLMLWATIALKMERVKVQKKDGMGTTHLSAIMPNMSVAVTFSINDFFGSDFISPLTAILLNNEMERFYLGDVRFPFNKIAPRKRPLSAKCPTVVVDSEGNFKLVTGTAGGKRIPPAVGQVSE